MERVKYSKVEVKHGNSVKKFPVYEIYLDDMIVTKVSSEMEAVEMVSRWQEIYNDYILYYKAATIRLHIAAAFFIFSCLFFPCLFFSFHLSTSSFFFFIFLLYLSFSLCLHYSTIFKASSIGIFLIFAIIKNDITAYTVMLSINMTGNICGA